MKKLLFLAALTVFGLNSIQAQEDGGSATSQGGWLIEINTGFGEASTANTGFGLWSRDIGDETITAWGVGGEVGYFVIDDLALKAGLGYADAGIDGIDGTFNWKFGGKYYIASAWPVGVDINGASGNDFSPLFLGIQAGYAWFVADNVSIEPGVRYGLGLNEDAGDGDANIFSVNIGFNLFID